LGAEVLIRCYILNGVWFILENSFKMVEETNLIVPIGQWVLETACKQLKAWEQDKLTKQLTLSVNVSTKQYRQADSR